jgi:hypothetical protein
VWKQLNKIGMSKIINKKTPKQFYLGDRQLLRDTRLSSDAKNIYQVLSSLAESCDNVCPSYIWLAQEVGYNIWKDEAETEQKSENTIMTWVRRNIEELINLKMVVQLRKDRGFDYEIYDYIPEIPTGQKSPLTLDKKVHPPLDKKVHLERREEKEEIRIEKNIKKENSKSNNFEEIKKINVEAMDQFKTKILENLNEFDVECKKRESKLKTQILDNEVAQNFIESNTQKIIDWIENKAKRSSLSDQPNPKNRFFDWVKRDIYSCYAYPPKPNYQANSSPPNNPTKPKIPNFVINKITL